MKYISKGGMSDDRINYIKHRDDVICMLNNRSGMQDEPLLINKTLNIKSKLLIFKFKISPLLLMDIRAD